MKKMISYSSDDLAQVVGEEYEPYWAMLMPELYYKDGSPHGVIGIHREGYMAMVYSMAKNDEFTVGMLRDIIRLYNRENICLITDVESEFDKIKKVLSRYNFTFARHIADNGKQLLYSIHLAGG